MTNQKAASGIGATIANRYRVERKLGEGGMGEVYLAVDQRTRGHVVVKLPWAGMLIDDPGLKDRFLREIRAMSKLDHGSIVKVYDVVEHEGRPVAVMQYLGGGSLDERPSASLDTWLPQIAGALDYVHEKRLVHRDVKPANIFFDSHGKAYLGDFGIVKPLEPGTTMFSRLHAATETGFTLGSPKYMAPETVAGKTVDGRADQYGLAVIVYERLAGRMPFDAETPAHIFAAHLSIEPRPLSEVDERFGRDTSDVVARALAKEPADRFPSCREFAAAVLNPPEATSKERAVPVTVRSPSAADVSPTVMGARPAALPEPSSGSRPALARQHRRWLAAAAVGAAVLLLGWMATGAFRTGDETAASVPPPSAPLSASSTPGTDSPAPTPSPPASPPFEVEYTVREGHAGGAPVEGAKVALIYTAPDGGSQVELGQETTDSSGHATISVPGSHATAGEGQYEAVITYAGQTRRALLDRFPDVRQQTLYAPVRPPEPLITVTLECDTRVVTFAALTLGVDIVNSSGRHSDPEAKLSRLTLECLPGAVVAVFFGENQAFLPLEANDDRQTLRFRSDGPVLYQDDRVCFVDYLQAQNAIDAARADDPTDQQRQTAREAERALGRLEGSGVRRADWRGVVLSHDDPQLVSRLQGLKNTGIAVVVPGSISKQAARALREVKPRRLFVSCQTHRLLGNDLPNLEALYLSMEAGTTLPNLSGATRLRHLLIAVEGKEHTVDLSPLNGLVQLRSLTLLSDGRQFRGMDALASLHGLQFLCVLDHEPIEPSLLHLMPRLQHLVAAFRVNTDLPAGERLPYLQTLGVLNIHPRHELGPLVSAPRLHVLALRSRNTVEGPSDPTLDNIRKMPNVQRFQEDRADVTLVEYRGMCLGSWWLVPTVLAAVGVACIARRIFQRISGGVSSA